MDARFHDRLVWVIAVALAGVAGCASNGSASNGGPAGGSADGGAPVPGKLPNVPGECVGPSWFGHMAERSRSPLVGLICTDAHSGTLAGGRLAATESKTCQGAYTARSDREITAVLVALDEGQQKMGSFAEANATETSVRDFGHQMSVAHGGSAEGLKSLSTRLRSRESHLSRALDRGFASEATTLEVARGAGFDQEFLGRTVVQHARAIEMLDALEPQAKDHELRCQISKARATLQAHLEVACVLRSSTTAAPKEHPLGTAGSADTDDADDTTEP
jgi:Domain of unknown function (DUF4142)